MIRFKQFLEAQTRPYDIDPLQDEAAVIEALHEHCASSIRGGAQIWRGTTTAHKSAIFHPETGTRTSKNVSNYYTVLLDSNPLNSDFPERSRSLIGTTRKGSAASYTFTGTSKEGELLALFPFDGVKVGVVNKSDIWQCQLEFDSLHLTETLHGMNDFWENFMQAIGKSAETPTMEQLMRLIRSHPDETFKELEDASYIGRDGDKRSTAEKFAGDLPNAYSFESMGCEVALAGKVRAERSEVWFSGPCVAVTQADWAAVEKEFGL